MSMSMSTSTSATRPGAASKPDGANFEESLASKPFLFIIGPEHKEFHVHKELIGQLSRVLNTLVNGSMKEAYEGRVEWPDLDVDTFVRFAKFAYSGDYAEAEPEIFETAIASTSRVPTPGSEVQGEEEAIDLTGHTEEDDDDDDISSSEGSEGSNEGSSESDELQLDAGSDDGDEDDSSSEDSTEASSTLDNRPGHNEIRPHGYQGPSYAQRDDSGFVYRRWSLPISVYQYMNEWEKYRQLLCDRDAASHDHKRKRGDYGAIGMYKPMDKKYDAMEDFARFPYSSTLVSRALPSVLRWEVNSNSNVSYLPVFLSHSRLYVLADKYGVENLRVLSLCRLHRLLQHFILFRQRIPDIVTLAQEVFANTIERDDAREVIVKYFACFIEHIRDSSELADLLRRGGDFPTMLIERMAMRL
ncbi:hypothetical protein NW762_002133 [Fusarium torreyae]|uniref:BTB domain-containing protein n=1 Tax=Fusarium torreyae TaxID=1237075 RepID=A0A9W8SFY7_9HYPO|nr:hypothetical protein NW762_002133 [Fusarium torreyae]